MLVIQCYEVSRQLPVTRRSMGDCRFYQVSSGPMALCGYSTHDTKHGHSSHLTHIAPANPAIAPLGRPTDSSVTATASMITLDVRMSQAATARCCTTMAARP